MGFGQRSGGGHRFGNFRQEKEGEKIQLTQFRRAQFQIDRCGSCGDGLGCLFALRRARAGGFWFATIVGTSRRERARLFGIGRRARLNLGELDHQSQEQADDGLQPSHARETNP